MKNIANTTQSDYNELCNDVTIAIEKIDEVAENAALDVLEADGRSIKFISEELGGKRLGKIPQFFFVLDPIDGTFNAVNNIPFFCVPVAIGD